MSDPVKITFTLRVPDGTPAGYYDELSGIPVEYEADGIPGVAQVTLRRDSSDGRVVTVEVEARHQGGSDG